MELICATSNAGKFATGRDTMHQYGIELLQKPIEVDEIQGSDNKKIVIEKAKSAHEVIQEPLVVTDDCWDIHALNGFPGAYMKEINGWFTVEKFLCLLESESDRSVSLIQNLAYTDGAVIKTFSSVSRGLVIEKARGLNTAPPWAKIVEIDGYDGKTIAEVYEDEVNGVKASEHDKKTAATWHELAGWLLNQP